MYRRAVTMALDGFSSLAPHSHSTPSTLGLHQLGGFNPQRSGELAKNMPTDPILAAEHALRAYGPLDAIDTYSAAVFEHTAVQTAAVMRCIGLMLSFVSAGPVCGGRPIRPILASIWPDKDYVDGDETRFLHGSGSLPE
jgi:hypothetical protein